MISIKKDFTNIPASLLSPETEKAFEENVQARKCLNEKHYKTTAVKKELDAIYHKKCAYCEKSLLDTDRHVEHYRPKSVYFWLAYSWDNLLLACAQCNRSKGDTFQEHLNGTPAEYANELFSAIHSTIKKYNQQELPLLLNPEQETDESLRLHFTFQLENGKIKPLSRQMESTIELCKLNRPELLELRMEYFNDLNNELKRDYLYCPKIATLIRTFKKFEDKITSPDAAFIAWQKFIYDNKEPIIRSIVMRGK